MRIENPEKEEENFFQKMYQKIKDGVILTFTIHLVLFPILICSFHQISFAFLFSTLLITPLLTAILILGTFILFLFWIFPSIAIFLTSGLNICLYWYLKIADAIAHIPGITIWICTPKPYWIFWYYLLVLWFFFGNRNGKKVGYTRNVLKKMLKKMILFVFFFNILIDSWMFLNQKFTISFLDVGQGDACLIQTKSGKNILIDGGGSISDSFQVGENILLPVLLNKGIRKIDLLILSHFDADHWKGCQAILENLSVSKVIIAKQAENSEAYQTFCQIVSKKKIPVEMKKAGDEVFLDGRTKLQFLWPEDTMISSNAMNNNALVFKVYYRNSSVLFTGDIEKEAEDAILQKYQKGELEADILKVAHHGSKTSSSEKFLDCIDAKIALIGVGKKNFFGHPSPEVIQNLKERGYQIYRTDQKGQIEIKIDTQDRITIKTLLNE